MLQDLIDYLMILVPAFIGLGLLWGIAGKLYECYLMRERIQLNKTLEAQNLMQEARYKALGVNCHSHCYVYGCKYDRIEDELLAMGIERDGIQRLFDIVRGVQPRKKCVCGKAFLPVLTNE